MRTLTLGLSLATAAAFGTIPAMAQDMSPHLLIETGPNDNPNYRRVVFVKYLSENEVYAVYRADNRTEFKRIESDPTTERVASCLQGPATSLSDIRDYGRDEARRAKRGKTPEVRSFCIKGVLNWNRGNRDAYLDPIFETLPVSIQGL